jgi:RNA-directed DNA polymerase
MVIVRFADDVIVGFQYESDARRFQAELAERLAKFNLELSADKTRLVEFGRFAAERRAQRGLGHPETFTFLGFVHICATTRAGKFQLKRTTIAKRMRAKLHDIKAKLNGMMHLPIPEQGAWLAGAVRGYYAYHAVPTNSRAMTRFRFKVIRLWYRALKRRSQRTRLKLVAHESAGCPMDTACPHDART